MELARKLRPQCRLTSPVDKLAKTLQSRLISCSLVDASGQESDSISIEISADGLFDWPQTGQLISCQFGYEEDDALTEMGTFKISRISQSLLPNRMTITGTAAPFQGTDETEFKKLRSYSWFDTTLGNVVRTLAGRHNLSPRVHKDLDSKAVVHIDQQGETDIAFLSRLAKMHDAVCKPICDLLVFARKGQVKALSGRVLASVEISYPADNQTAADGFVSCQLSSADRAKFSGVSAHWYDGLGAIQVTEKSGNEPFKQLSARFESQQDAIDAVSSEMRRIEREGDRLSLQCIGNPLLAAESLLTLTDFPGERFNRTWSIDRVTHSYDGSYRCAIEATLPIGDD